jgi:hypothetical protein
VANFKGLGGVFTAVLDQFPHSAPGTTPVRATSRGLR